METKPTRNFLFYLSIIVFALILLFVLVKSSVMIHDFPSSDFSSHLAKIFFMHDTGFGKTIYWFSGYYPFLDYPPLSSIIGAFFFWITKNIGLSLYMLMILIVFLCFTGFLFLKSIKKWSFKETLFFFLLFLANPVTSVWFFEVGRVTEFLGWVSLIFIFGFVYKYKDSDFDKKFFLIIIPLSLSIISHPASFFLSFFPLLVLLIAKIKKPRQIFSLCLSVLIALLITSFYWFPMIQSRSDQVYAFNLSSTYSSNLLPVERFYAFLFPIIIFLFLFFKKNSKHTLIPLLILAVIYITHLIGFIPVYNYIFSRSYAILILLFLIVDSDISITKKKLFLILAILFSISSLVFFNFVTISDYDAAKKSINLLERHAPENFVIISNNIDQGIIKDVYSYAPIYLNYTTPFGWFTQAETLDLANKRRDLNSQNCTLIKSTSDELKVDLIISDECSLLEDCGFKLVDKEDYLCLMET